MSVYYGIALSGAVFKEIEMRAKEGSTDGMAR
jgi:hypothetical protein